MMFKLLNGQCLTGLKRVYFFQTCQCLDGYLQGYKMFNAIGERTYSNLPAAAITGQQLLLGNYV